MPVQPSRAVLESKVEGPCGARPDNIVARPELLPGERESFMALAGVLSPEAYEDVLAMVIKKFFTSDLAVTDVFGWFGAITEASGQPALAARVRSHEEHCLVRR